MLESLGASTVAWRSACRAPAGSRRGFGCSSTDPETTGAGQVEGPNQFRLDIYSVDPFLDFVVCSTAEAPDLPTALYGSTVDRYGRRCRTLMQIVLCP